MNKKLSIIFLMAGLGALDISAAPEDKGATPAAKNHAPATPGEKSPADEYCKKNPEDYYCQELQEMFKCAAEGPECPGHALPDSHWDDRATFYYESLVSGSWVRARVQYGTLIMPALQVCCQANGRQLLSKEDAKRCAFPVLLHAWTLDKKKPLASRESLEESIEECRQVRTWREINWRCPRYGGGGRILAPPPLQSIWLHADLPIACDEHLEEPDNQSEPANK